MLFNTLRFCRFVWNINNGMTQNGYYKKIKLTIVICKLKWICASFQLFMSVLLDIQLSEGESRDLLNPATFLCLSQSRTWNLIAICHGLFCVQWLRPRGDCLFCWYRLNIWPLMLNYRSFIIRLVFLSNLLKYLPCVEYCSKGTAIVW